MEFLRRRLGLIFRTLVSVVLIVWLIDKIDWVKFWSIVRNADVYWLILAFACFVPVLLVVSWRWRMLLHVHGVRLRFWRVFEFNMIGQFFSAFLLGTTGGDVIKIFYVARAVPDRKAAVSFTVILDRVIGMVALLIFGGILAATQLTLFFSKDVTKFYTGLFYLFVVGGVVGSILASLGPSLLQHRTIQSLFQRLPMAHHSAALLSAYEKSTRAVGINLIALIGSVPSHVCIMLMGYCILCALNMQPPLLPFCAIIAIVNMLIALPISISGIGVREWLFIAFFALLKIDKDHALAFSITFFVLNSLWSLVGALFYFLYRHETHAPAPNVEEANPIFSEP